ncbi:hypothetical protein Pla175_07930 [Pirellulimonas nuda]|uniref:Uncharacterized protein n=1 Tax=Pirellulimonas nuda TaxID=2528009 RepID=A0A518D7H2_9BACT|nr:hypothetical protein [Pirellulimonas nuda]QDU87432.1 hypothetical protein Pla175_07930 [Pirellulimonas nuda]
MILRTTPLALLLSLALLSSGCEQPAAPPKAAVGDEQDHADHPAPTTLGEAVHQLEELRDEVKKAFEAGTPEVAHDALHHVGGVLTAAQKMAGDLKDDAKESAKSAVDSLFEAFGKLDGSLHDGADVAYDEVGDGIDAAIEKLEALVPEDQRVEHDEPAKP